MLIHAFHTKPLSCLFDIYIVMNNRSLICALKHYELDKIYEKNAILHFIFVKIFLSRDWDKVMVDWMLLISLQMFFS